MNLYLQWIALLTIVSLISYGIGRWDGKRKESKRIAKRFAKVNASLTYVQRKKSNATHDHAWPKITDVLTVVLGLVVVGAILLLVSLVMYEL